MANVLGNKDEFGVSNVLSELVTYVESKSCIDIRKIYLITSQQLPTRNLARLGVVLAVISLDEIDLCN